MTEISAPELAVSYPPQSAFFINSNNQRIEVIDAFNKSMKMTFAGGAPADAFGRLRTVDPRTLGDYKITYIDSTDYTQSLTSTADITFDFNKSVAFLTTGASGGTAIQQSKMYHNYSPGKSQLILMSFTMGAAVENCTKRVGYFDDKNGLFFEQDGDGDLSFKIRSDTSGSVDDDVFNQADWNGEDVSWLDITKSQLLFIDFQWLGVGRVRFGFVHEDSFVVAHTSYHSNELEIPYMRNPNLPVRFEISGGIDATLTQICSTVFSEGGYAEIGNDFAAATTASKTVGTTASPVVAIRLKNSFNGFDNRGYIRYLATNVVSSGQTIEFEVAKLESSTTSSISGGTWTSVGTSSLAEYNIGATSFSGGVFIVAGFVVSGGVGAGFVRGVSSDDGSNLAKKTFIAQNFDSTDSEVFVITAKTFSGTSSVLASLQWREIY
jgi:hypothetical protein